MAESPIKDNLEELCAKNAELRAENAELRKELATLTWRFSAMYAMFTDMLAALIEVTSTYYGTEFGWYCEDHHYSKGSSFSPDDLEMKLYSINKEYDVSHLCEGIDLTAHYIDIDDDDTE